MTREDGPITTELQQQDIEKMQKYKEAFIVLPMFISTVFLRGSQSDHCPIDSGVIFKLPLLKASQPSQVMAPPSLSS